jgi:hypothetical protein
MNTISLGQVIHDLDKSSEDPCILSSEIRVDTVSQTSSGSTDVSSRSRLFAHSKSSNLMFDMETIGSRQSLDDIGSASDLEERSQTEDDVQGYDDTERQSRFGTLQRQITVQAR